MTLFLFHLAAFLSAFLLFQIELIISKKILPFYGGSYLVWGACLVFFQACLLMGYLFVHKMIKKVGIIKYRFVFLFMAISSFMLIIVKPLSIASKGSFSFMMGDIFWDLFKTIGPAFFVLSTVSTSLQMWLASSALKGRHAPYTLFAASNAGSLSALASYPFLFEYFLGLRQQEMLWISGNGLLVILCLCLTKKAPIEDPLNTQERTTLHVPRRLSLAWFLFSGGAVMMFMAMTNILTSALGPIPLIWITPLGIYLITFILTFKKKCWCPSWIEKSMPILLVLSAYSFFDFESIFFPLYAKFFWLSLIIFVSCLFCHAQLVKTGLGFGYSLTKFYTILAFGGFIGGLTTTWIAPIISKSFIEYPIALTWIAIASLILTPPKNRIRAILLLLVPVCLLQVCLKDIQNKNPNILYQHRNYYGIYKVIQNNKLRLLIHQTTVHGAQIQAKQLELEPSSFYSRTSAIGEVFESNLFTPRKIAVVGLGAGTLSAYAEPDTHMDFYELDPEIYQIAKKYFTYLSKAQGTFQYIFGDARLSFKKNNDEKYDFLVLDAFGGSSIPTHLITKEAVRTYRNHLSNQGILFFHVSSTHARLESVLLDIASEFKGSILRKTTSGAPYGIPSVWIALTWSQSSFKKLAFNLKWSPVYSLEKKWRRVWTDDYSSILQIVDYRKFKKLFVMEKISKDFADAFIGNSYIDR